jgi:para-nitrobenzyl esterase
MRWCSLPILLLLSIAPATAEQSVTGIWYDRSRPGHGVDVQRIGNTALALIYSYGAEGEPEWFAAQGDLAAQRLAFPLLRFRAGPGASLPASSSLTGSFEFVLGADPASAPCAGTTRPAGTPLARLELEVDGERTRWCLEPLIAAPNDARSSMSGTWFAGGADSGWGLTSYFVPSPVTGSFHLIYFYDGAGNPRWAIAESADPDFELAADWIAYRGYCRTCAAAPLVARTAGRLNLRLTSPRADAGLDNRLAQTLAFPGPGAGRFDRDTRLTRFSDTNALPGVIATREGIVAGRDTAGDTTVWYALPFAAPPLGNLRLRAPQAPASRSSVLSAAGFAPSCPQADTASFFGAAPAAQNEDCLTLNVWAPRAPATTPRPVMIWIHGGGHIQGGAAQISASDQAIYDGSQFARLGVVLVSINYRLGALGYAAFRELIGEFPDQPGAGNYGLLDQIAALAWVRDNIAAFGGDPNNVTIFGESAGGVSVCALLASPRARGLFQRAIMQSGNCRLGLSRLTIATGTIEAAVDQGERIKQRLGCSGLDARACLRAKSTAEFVAAQQGAIFTSEGEGYEEVIDGYALFEQPGDAILRGEAAAVPFLIGINEDEATSLIPLSQRYPTAAAYEAAVRSALPQITAPVLAQYPASAYDPVWRAWTALVSDVSFICPARRVARDHVARGRSAYAYYFTQTLPQLPELGAFHAIEIPFLFTSMSSNDAAIQNLAAQMKALWVAYARTGIPAAPGVPAWPVHGANGAIGLELRADGIRVRSDYRAEFCDFWARYLRL